MHSARSPVYSHLSESLLGLSTIRTFGRQQTAQEYFHEYLNQYSQGCYLFIVTTRWFGMRIDGLTTILLAAVAFSCIPLSSSKHRMNFAFKTHGMIFVMFLAKVLMLDLLVWH